MRPAVSRTRSSDLDSARPEAREDGERAEQTERDVDGHCAPGAAALVFEGNAEDGVRLVVDDQPAELLAVVRPVVPGDDGASAHERLRRVRRNRLGIEARGGRDRIALRV